MVAVATGFPAVMRAPTMRTTSHVHKLAIRNATRRIVSNLRFIPTLLELAVAPTPPFSACPACRHRQNALSGTPGSPAITSLSTLNGQCGFSLFPVGLADRARITLIEL